MKSPPRQKSPKGRRGKAAEAPLQRRGLTAQSRGRQRKLRRLKLRRESPSDHAMSTAIWSTGLAEAASTFQLNLSSHDAVVQDPLTMSHVPNPSSMAEKHRPMLFTEASANDLKLHGQAKQVGTLSIVGHVKLLPTERSEATVLNPSPVSLLPGKVTSEAQCSMSGLLDGTSYFRLYASRLKVLGCTLTLLGCMCIRRGGTQPHASCLPKQALLQVQQRAYHRDIGRVFRHPVLPRPRSI